VLEDEHLMKLQEQIAAIPVMSAETAPPAVVELHPSNTVSVMFTTALEEAVTRVHAEMDLAVRRASILGVLSATHLLMREDIVNRICVLQHCCMLFAVFELSNFN
jgi:hypothetical protein